jgi:hypothetical protein
MSITKVLRIPIADLNVLRVTCRSCGSSTEIPLDQVARRFHAGTCLSCHTDILGGEPRSKYLTQLPDVLERIVADKQAEVEFVVPAPE